MLKNYMRVALRTMFRNKLFTAVNMLGLAFGMASGLLIFLWVADELAVDQFHTRVGQLYRVMENQQYSDGRLYTFSATPGPMAPFIKDKYPEIEKATRYTWEVNELFQVEDKSFFEKGRYADQDFLDMFTFPLLKGDVTTALKEKNSIVISRAMASKYFGDDEPLGKLMVLNTKHSFTVTGVLEDIPANSSIKFEYLLPFSFYFDQNKFWLDMWDNNNIRTFIQLRAGSDAAAFSRKFENELKEHVKETETKLFIQPVGEMYLHGEFENGLPSGGRIEYVQIFFVVAIFVLLIACINFMNLATAQAGKRAKEAGMRKVIGAVPTQLFRQFMGESFFLVAAGGILSLGIALLALPFFNQLAEKNLSLSLLNGRMALIFLSMLLATALIAGSYPAFYLSGFRPAEVLKGQMKSGQQATTFRKALVVAQFLVSIFLIISTIVVYRQMTFMENKDVGFNRDNMLYVWMAGDMTPRYETIRNQLLHAPGIESVTASGQLPIDIGNSTTSVDWEGKDPNTRILFSVLNVDFDFIPSMQMTLADGRPFDRNLVTDTSNYIINEVAAEKLGFKGNVAGQDLTLWGQKGKIAGVVRNFNFGSLHNPIDPLILHIRPKEFSCLLVRVRENEEAAAIQSVESVWKTYASAYPFKFSFLNQDWENYYKSEGQRGKIFNSLAVLSIVISCLGLFGLSAYSAQRRTKELGVRKVLGASVPSLLQLMGREFTTLVLVAALLGCPLSWWVMTQWLQQYAYHVDVGILSLIMATVVCLLVSLATVAYHALKASLHNPVHSLRYE